MYSPCMECLNRYGRQYTEDCDNTCEYAHAVKIRDACIEDKDVIIHKLEIKLKECGPDRNTALSILKEFSRDMHPSTDLFGKPTLVIDRYQFEKIRAKYLDTNKVVKED